MTKLDDVVRCLPAISNVTVSSEVASRFTPDQLVHRLIIMIQKTGDDRLQAL